MKDVLSEIGLHLWDMEDIKKEIKGKGLYEISKIYKEIDEKLNTLCVAYVTATGSLKEDILEKCNKLAREKMLVALRVMDDIVTVNL